jgi:hypothetical protein
MLSQPAHVDVNRAPIGGGGEKDQGDEGSPMKQCPQRGDSFVSDKSCKCLLGLAVHGETWKMEEDSPSLGFALICRSVLIALLTIIDVAAKIERPFILIG